MATRPAGSHVSAWRPTVAGVAEVFHAHFVDHAYPPHTHDVWTLLIVDDGAVRFDLDRHRHGALRTSVTLLPPHVPHDGRSATPHGFRKRVLYLDTSALGVELAGRAVDRPNLADPHLRHRIHHLHQVLAERGTSSRPTVGSRSSWNGSAGSSASRLRPAACPAHAASPTDCVSCWTPGPSRASRCARPPSCCTPTQPTWSGRSPTYTGCRRTRT